MRQPFQVDDEVPEAEEDEKQVDDDAEHDSLIKAPKKGKATATGKGKAAAKPKALKKS